MSEIDKLLWTVFNIFTFSVPEEAFNVIFSLIIINRFDVLEFKWRSIRKLLLPILFPAVTTNILRIYFNFDMYSMPPYAIFTLSLLIILVYRIRGLKEYVKVISSVALGMFIVMLLQMIYIPIILYGTSITVEQLQVPGLLNILVSLPERVTELLLLIFLFVRKNTFSKISIMSIIGQSTMLSLLSVITVLYNMLFLYLLGICIYYNKFLYTLPLHLQLLIIAAACISPLINFAILISVVVYITDKEAKEKFRIQEELMVSIKDIEFYLKRQEYEKIQKELQLMEKDTKALYKN